MTDLFTPLNEQEMDQLDQFMLYRIAEDAETESRDEGVLDISTLDGFFTALVSGPVMMPPSQWLAELWGDFEPDWRNEKEFETIFSLLMRHMNTIAATLVEEPDRFFPIFYEREFEGETFTIVDEWCEGYARGMALSAEQWIEGGEKMDSLLEPVLAFTSLLHWPAHDLSDDAFKAAHNEIVNNVREIHAYWLTRRDDNLSSPKPVRSREQRVGRNDPCPCGSGKKYKKCCLH